MKDILWGILSDEMVLLLNWLTTIKIRANTNLKGRSVKAKNTSTNTGNNGAFSQERLFVLLNRLWRHFCPVYTGLFTTTFDQNEDKNNNRRHSVERVQFTFSNAFSHEKHL